jgi:hypothetical protein
MIKITKYTKKLLLIIFTLVTFTNLGNAQSSLDPNFGSTYTTAVGVRGIGTSGLTIKHFNRKDRAIEGILGFYPNAFSATVLLEKYTPAFDVRGLNWYYGIGGHVATQSNVIQNEGIYRREASAVGFGVDGIFAMEYKAENTPIAISMDLKPILEIVSDGGSFIALDPGLGIKLTF